MLQAVAWVLYHSESSGLDKLVLVYIADYYNTEERCAWPAISTIADKARVSLSTVKRAIATLEELGELIVEERLSNGGTNMSNVYRLPKFDSSNSTPGGSHRTPGGCSQDPGVGFSQNHDLVSSDPVKEQEVATTAGNDYRPLREEKRVPLPKPNTREERAQKKEQRRREAMGFGPSRSRTAPAKKQEPPESWGRFAKKFLDVTEVLPHSHPDNWAKLETRLQSSSAREIGQRLETWYELRGGKVNPFAVADFLGSEFDACDGAGRSGDLPSLGKPWEIG